MILLKSKELGLTTQDEAYNPMSTLKDNKLLENLLGSKKLGKLAMYNINDNSNVTQPTVKTFRKT